MQSLLPWEYKVTLEGLEGVGVGGDVEKSLSKLDFDSPAFRSHGSKSSTQSLTSAGFVTQ